MVSLKKEIKVQLHVPTELSAIEKIQELTNQQYISQIRQQLKNSRLTLDEKKDVVNILIKAAKTF